MRFGAVPLEEAEGAILVHSQRLAGGTLKKGRVLSAEDVGKLREAGVDSVVTARLEDGDIGEDEAAAAVAAALAGDNVTAAEAFTGRCNLSAGAHGVVRIDRDRLERLNRIHEAVTVATVTPWTVAEPKQMLATIKIIPFAVPRDVLDAVLDAARGEMPLVSVAPFVPHAVGLVMTRLPGTREKLLDSTEEATRNRVEALGSVLKDSIRCGHDEEEIAEAVATLRGGGCSPILVAGASATVDRRDVAPAGVVRAGGEVIHFGMPVDPGNLILLATLGDIPVLVLPGCARSPKENGLDWVLRRLLVDMPVAPADIMDMGSGGFLKDIPSRPMPRGRRREPEAAGGRRVVAVVLAAGQSRRMGGVNKLVAEVAGKPMVRHAVEAALASKAGPVIVVAGHQAKRVREALQGCDVTVVENRHYAQGLSTSLKRGIAAAGEIDPPVDGAVVLLGDMPTVSPADLDRLIAAFDPEEGRAICAPTFNGKRGNPVLWGREFFDDMAGLTGDVGAKHLIGENADRVCDVPMATQSVLTDVDTPEALAALEKAKAG